MRIPKYPVPIALVGCVSLASCMTTSGSPESTGSGGQSLSCPELSDSGDVDTSAQVDPRVLSFMEAAGDLRKLVGNLKPAVKAACIGVATDLGAQDTWSALGDSDDAVSNSGGTGACDAARAKIQSVLQGNVNGTFALAISRGECFTDFSAEASCEAKCQADQTCTPGTCETRCSPGELNVSCQGKCNANAFCEGSTTVATTCEGSCEAECTGHCSATCVDEQGNQTTDDANCHGKCNGHCSGSCDGRCKIDVSSGVQCGANVTCTGGCTGSYTNPRCEEAFNPPTCTVDETCFEHCRSSVATTVKCDPDTVKLLTNVTASGDVAKLVATIDKNLPPLLQAAESQGRIAEDIVQDVLNSGNVVLNAAGSLDVHSAACATAAASSLTTSASSLSVSVQASANVGQSISTNVE